MKGDLDQGVWCIGTQRDLSVDGLDVERLDEVETGEDTSAGDTTENVGTITLEEGGDTLVSENLSTAVESGFVVNT